MVASAICPRGGVVEELILCSWGAVATLVDYASRDGNSRAPTGEDQFAAVQNWWLRSQEIRFSTKAEMGGGGHTIASSRNLTTMKQSWTQAHSLASRSYRKSSGC